MAMAMTGWQLLALGCGLGAAGLGWASPIEHAVDTTGLAGAVPLAYGDHTVNATLTTGQEIDAYTFAGHAGDSVRFLIAGQTVGLDPTITLRDPGGAIVNSVFCNSPLGGACTTLMDQVLPLNGTYTLNISDAGLDEAGAYQLHVEQFPPVNNWAGMHYATPVVEQLGHSTDIDFYAFTGRTGTQVQVSVAGLTVGLDPVLQIWDPSGTRITNTFCNSPLGGACVVSVDLSLVLDGTYKLGVWDSGADETGNYRVTVSCLFGACPLATDPVPSVPEPRSGLLLLGGAAVLGLLRRRRT